MTLGRLLPVLPILLSLAPFSPTPAGADQGYALPHGVRVTEYNAGHPLCPVRKFVIGDVPIRGGRCYVLVVVRDIQGAFLGLVDPAAKIPPSRLVSLDTPEGQRMRARILYLVPVPPEMSGRMLLIPPNTLQLVRLRQEDDEVQDSDSNPQGGYVHTHVVGSRLTVIMTGPPLPNMSMTFAVHF
jgi:hypothetical protein